MFLYSGHLPKNLDIIKNFEKIITDKKLWMELKQSINLNCIVKNNKLSNLKKILF